jgi:DNA-binding NarL/FixJ family response regulator
VSDKFGEDTGHVRLVNPAVTFTFSFFTIAYLIYLYSENNRIYMTSLVANFKSSETNKVHVSTSSADKFEGLGLTPREKEVCSLLLKSLSIRQIAGELGLQFSTVNGYYRSLYRKLGINSKGELFMRFGVEAQSEETVVDDAES